ncbi:hypothetical protein I204_00618 [Kwoniella mangroviensis CBS 8886]|uniref:uncharacterized protein n=1 Tax=Kwoniella mangroviensis CBS 8507 TaxID=1296122 RepID=UPI00080D76E2|nr:uncharacterized protein I203_07134 [Kwoniella mangroviensis CBS 8507]OCF63813.1 hypothetical protein I203_07134 [Kwoniella mangroviensis CBS 8507]OCF78676.1 hypothetical protein I204_00618 [Kwoniella mangroviensis CBS 8886]
MTDKTKNQILFDDHSRDFQFEDSDVTIRTSDDVTFKIHRFHLMAVSAVFCDMMAIGKGQNEELCLTDESFEDASTIGKFLYFCYGKSLPAPATKEHTPYQKLINLCNKYECPGVLAHLEALVYKWYIEDCLCPRNVFVLGYSLNQPKLAIYGITHAGNWQWSETSMDITEAEKTKSKDRTAVISSVIGCSALDPSGLTYHDFVDIPDAWKFPLVRATWGKIKDGELSKTDWKKIAEDFERIFKMVNGDSTC